MRLPRTAHTSQHWRIHEIAPDFRVEDVWALPTPGGRDDFPQLMRVFFDGDFPGDTSPLTRLLWAARQWLGALLRLDREKDGVGKRVPSLRDRLPADLRDGPTGPQDTDPFSPLYLLDDEWAAEMANRTVHTVMHLAWVSDGAGGHRGQMAVLVKPNGLMGKAYMAAIVPFRHLIVYPALMRFWERRWKQRTGASA